MKNMNEKADTNLERVAAAEVAAYYFLLLEFRIVDTEHCSWAACTLGHKGQARDVCQLFHIALHLPSRGSQCTGQRSICVQA